jgi:deoxyribose-phosphate aldolase
MSIPGKETLTALLARADEGSVPAADVNWLSELIDHTSLKLDVTEEQIRQLCGEAREHKFGAVCVRVNYVALCVSELKGSGVKVASVVGFHTGSDFTGAKVSETTEAVRLGATEIDMVMKVERMKAGELSEVYEDIRAVVRAAGEVPVKVILETCLLTRDEILMASALAKAAGAAFLKTSTGFSTGGATVADVELLRSVAKNHIGVKASGGVRTTADALRMVLAGANRIGTSGGVAIVSGKSPQEKQTGVY